MWRIQENTGRFVFSFLLNLLNLLFVTFLQSRTEGYASLGSDLLTPYSLRYDWRYSR